MIFLPENADFMERSPEATYQKSQSLDGEFIGNYKKLASELNLWISIGSFHRKVFKTQ